METIEFQLKGEHVRLCDLLKLIPISTLGTCATEALWNAVLGGARSGRSHSKRRNCHQTLTGVTY